MAAGDDGGATPVGPVKTPKKRFAIDRQWLRQSTEVGAVDTPVATSCSLRQSRPCCQGRGYVIAVEGPLLAAKVCDCVRECPGCAGRARVMVGNDSKPCREPSPNVVVNLLNAAHIPARYAMASLDRFQNFTGNARDLLPQLGRWLERFRAVGDRGIVIEGPIGVGKTYILAAMAKELASRGLSVRFIDFFQLQNELKAGFSVGKADSAQLAPLIGVDVLFIDELGKGRNTEYEMTVLDQLVCGRYNQNKAIVATTNYQLGRRAYAINPDLDKNPNSSGNFTSDQFASLEQRIGARIFSRLKEMTTFVELTGRDWRRLESGATVKHEG